MTAYFSKNFSLRKGLFLSATLFIYLFSSCKDDGSVVPTFTSGNLKFQDIAIEVKSETVRGDSVLTGLTSRSLFGKLNDQTYGLSSSEIFTQVYLSTSSLVIPDDVVFDSIVLYLAFDNFYGFTYEQELLVYELDEALEDDKDYYSTSTVPSKNLLLGSAKVMVNDADTFADSTFVVRVKLDNSLADRIKEVGTFANQAAWLEFFNGLRITTNEAVIPSDAGDGEGAIVYFDLVNSNTKMSLYYTSTEGTESENLIIADQSIRFSHFENVYSTSLEGTLDDSDVDFNYIFAMGGSRTRITFPNIDSIAASAPIAINKAQLIIPYEEPSVTQFTAPERNVLIMKDNEDAWVLPDDFFKSGADYFGGYRDQINKQYVFNLASTMHDIINNGNLDTELYLSVSGSAVTANRLKINSGKKSAGRREIFLILSYTKSG